LKELRENKSPIPLSKELPTLPYNLDSFADIVEIVHLSTTDDPHSFADVVDSIVPNPLGPIELADDEMFLFDGSVGKKVDVPTGRIRRTSIFKPTGDEFDGLDIDFDEDLVDWAEELDVNII
jgi:hypothetical protein